jgi:cytochrome c biogenesis protein CcmG/thiol:disulfide interchange protein DsbE
VSLDMLPGVQAGALSSSAAAQRRLKLGRLSAAAAVVGFLTLLAVGLANVGSGGPGVNWKGGPAAVAPRPAPPLVLRLLDGGSWRLPERPGRPTLVNFWAFWCQPCRDEAPALAAAQRRYGDRLDLIGVDLWDAEADARAFAVQLGVTYPLGVDADGSAAVDYGVRGIPESFLIDRDGRLVRRWIGPLAESDLPALLAGVVQ